jgi:hypothetical protein
LEFGRRVKPKLVNDTVIASPTKEGEAISN